MLLQSGSALDVGLISTIREYAIADPAERHAFLKRGAGLHAVPPLLEAGRPKNHDTRIRPLRSPPRASGLQPEVFRAYLLDRGEVQESALPLDSIRESPRLFLINSVRRWCEVHLVRHPSSR